MKYIIAWTHIHSYVYGLTKVCINAMHIWAHINSYLQICISSRHNGLNSERNVSYIYPLPALQWAYSWKRTAQNNLLQELQSLLQLSIRTNFKDQDFDSKYGFDDFTQLIVRCFTLSSAAKSLWTTVYPKKYAHGYCFAVLCCDYTLTDFPISIRLTSLALWQSNDCPSASKANPDEYG